ncbi:MAG: ABC transporter permease [Peptostreptococcaceae bacterium]|nr:ABC transporter permease [Peptostreptococcaceae bacterium]
MNKAKKRHRRWGILSLLLLACILLISLRGERIPSDMANKLAPPDLFHPFGTDYMGRDLFLLTVTGFRNSFLLSAASQLIPVVLGGFLGALLGFRKGLLDEVLFHIFNILLAFPILLAAVFMSVFIGTGVITVLVVISLFGTIYNAKIVRAEIGQVRNEDFVIALRINGIPERRIFWHHMLPRAYYILFPLIPILVGHSMIAVSSYSFLGLGVSMSTPEIGLILKDSLRFAHQAPWLIFYPGIFQFAVVLIFSFYSDSLEAFLKEGGLRS